jgi:hypothetical protein
MSAAAACPTAIPRVVAPSDGSAAIAAAYFAASVPPGSPRYNTSVSYPAAITAADSDACPLLAWKRW